MQQPVEFIKPEFIKPKPVHIKPENIKKKVFIKPEILGEDIKPVRIKPENIKKKVYKAEDGVQLGAMKKIFLVVGMFTFCFN